MPLAKTDWVKDLARLLTIHMVYLLVMDRVPDTWVSGFGSDIEKWILGKLTMAFLHFLSNFWHIWLFLKVEHASWRLFKTLKNHQICPCLNRNFWLIPLENLILGTRSSVTNVWICEIYAWGHWNKNWRDICKERESKDQKGQIFACCRLIQPVINQKSRESFVVWCGCWLVHSVICNAALPC